MAIAKFCTHTFTKLLDHTKTLIPKKQNTTLRHNNETLIAKANRNKTLFLTLCNTWQVDEAHLLKRIHMHAYTENNNRTTTTTV